MPATIERHELISPLAQSLIATLNRELSAQYPEEGANHFRLDPEEVAEGHGAFLVVFLDSEPVGCGAVRRKGLGKALLAELENEARRLGACRLVLETGPRQDAALAHVPERRISRDPVVRRIHRLSDEHLLRQRSRNVNRTPPGMEASCCT
jgi:GNAT superfamily N-acetyltransferase